MILSAWRERDQCAIFRCCIYNNASSPTKRLFKLLKLVADMSLESYFWKHSMISEAATGRKRAATVEKKNAIAAALHEAGVRTFQRISIIPWQRIHHCMWATQRVHQSGGSAGNQVEHERAGCHIERPTV